MALKPFHATFLIAALSFGACAELDGDASSGPGDNSLRTGEAALSTSTELVATEPASEREERPSVVKPSVEARSSGDTVAPDTRCNQSELEAKSEMVGDDERAAAATPPQPVEPPVILEGLAWLEAAAAREQAEAAVEPEASLRSASALARAQAIADGAVRVQGPLAHDVTEIQALQRAWVADGCANDAVAETRRCLSHPYAQALEVEQDALDGLLASAEGLEPEAAERLADPREWVPIAQGPLPTE